jgi:RNA polymerase sigma factor (sigma-70 family)
MEIELQGGLGRMADAEKQPAVRCDGSAVIVQSHADTVSCLFRDNNRVLVRYLAARLRSEQEAKEVAQEAYVRLLQMQRGGSLVSIRAYLFKTATNLAIDRLRHRRVRQRVEQTETAELWTSARSDAGDPAKLLLARELTAQLVAFLQELPPKCREAFSLHRLDGTPQHEVAATHRLSTAAVDPVAAESWRGGVLPFVGEPLEEVVGEINRYSGRKIDVAPGFRQTRFTGTVSLGHVEEWLNALPQIFSVEVIGRGSNDIHIRPRVANDVG